MTATGAGAAHDGVGEAVPAAPVVRAAACVERRELGAPETEASGEISSAASAATTATTAPAMPMDLRKPSGKTVRVAIATATVAAEKTTERPAVRIVVRDRLGGGARAATSSR